MQVNRQTILTVAIRGTLLVPLALALAGCQARPAEWSELGRPSSPDRTRGNRGRVLLIEPLSNREVAQLSPDDVVRVTRRIGFTDQQILDLGMDLYEALLLSGAARVMYRGKVEALLRVQGDHVLIYSGSRGSHVYNLTRGEFRIGPSG